MKNEQVIYLSDIDKAKVRQLIEAYQRAGLDSEKAAELGYYSRMSYLLCAMYSLYTVAYRLFGEVDNLIELTGSKRFGIKKAIEDFNKAYDKFFLFFRDFQTVEGVRDLNEDTECLYHQFMRWCLLPEKWEGGQPQINKTETDPLIVIENENKNINFYRKVVDTEQIEEPIIRWCITKYDKKNHTQNTMNIDGLDKSLAQMIAKRESANDPTHIYTAGQLITYHEKRIEIVPMKAYEKGEIVGDYRKLIKSTVSE